MDSIRSYDESFVSFANCRVFAAAAGVGPYAMLQYTSM